MKEIRNTIVTIDPGASGSIVVYINGRAQAVKMPKEPIEMNEYFEYIKRTHENIVVFIEKVQAYSKGDDTPGKKFGINKMLANYSQLLTIIKINGFRFVEVYPVTWQSVLGLSRKKPKGMDFYKFKSIRKNLYKEYAQKHFPGLKVTLATSDALCLVRFAIIKIEQDIGWIRERIQN